MDTMNLTKTRAFTLILLGILLGVLFTNSHYSLAIGSLFKSTFAQSVADNPIAGTNIFADVAEKVMPTVVTVYSEKVVRIRRPNFFSFPDDDFFDWFFGEPGTPRSRREPQYEEFRQEGLGSGVVVTSDGFILTNNHVVANADDIKVKVGDRTYEANIIGADDKTDLAVLRIHSDKPLEAAELGDSDKVRVGEWVLAIGHPFSLDHTVTAGIISAKGRNRIGITDYEDFLQTDAAINPGNSGGALVNLEGKVVGINTAIASRTGVYNGVGFAIPSNMAKSVMNQLIEHGKVVRGYIGIGIQDVSEELATAFGLDKAEGVLITKVMPGTPASKADLRQGDIILSINGKKLADASELRYHIASSSPGTEIELKIFRNGKNRTVKLKLTELLDEITSAPQQIGAPDAVPELGLTLESTGAAVPDEYGFTYGLVVVNVHKDSPAAEAGVKEGDIIFEVNREPFNSIEDYLNIIRNTKKGNPVLLLIGRDGNFLYIAVRYDRN